MGYNSYISGEIVISPQVSVSDELDGLPTISVPKGNFVYRIKDGVSHEIVTTNKDEQRAGELKKELTQLVSQVQQVGRAFVGIINVEGANSRDIWRLRVDNSGKVVEERPRMIWPAGDQEQL
jgi:hypothetical protein